MLNVHVHIEVICLSFIKDAKEEKISVGTKKVPEVEIKNYCKYLAYLSKNNILITDR